MQINNSSLDKIKDEVINSILNDLTSSEKLTSEEVQFKRQELEQKIKDKQLITQLKTQSGVTSAQEFNDTIEELYIDILTTFGYLNSLDETIDQHINVNQTTINNLKTLIAKANDRIDTYEAILGSRGNPNHYIEGFRDAQSFEEDLSLYTERYGEKIPATIKTYFNVNEGYINLNFLRHQNMITYKNDVSLGSINIKKQLGSGLIRIKNNMNSLQNIIDTSLQSYWSESILTDSPLRVSFDSIKPIDPLELQDFYYGLQHGALCELELTFESISTVNEIELMPYGQYPIDIVAIRYKTSDDTEEPLKEIVYPTNSNETLRGMSIKGPASLRFPNIVCKKLYILINQIHYIKSTYIYSPNEVFKNELWFSLTNGKNLEPRLENDMLFIPNYLDRSMNDNVWAYINNMSVKNKSLDLKKILFEGSRPNQSVTKYQYTYGFYNIAPNFNEFQQTGIYVSKPISANGNIKSIRISTDETHPLDEGGNRWTDIEYYISYSKKPEWYDWTPILPVNIDYVKCEYLQTENDRCFLRHKATAINIVYRDGDKLNVNSDYFIHFDNEGYIIALSIPNFDYHAKYTVSYEPRPESTILNLITDNNELILDSFETFDGNNESFYSLANYPYLSTNNSVATDIKIIDKETGIIQLQSNNDILCVTDPYNPSESYKFFDKHTSKIQYYTDKNGVYFNTKIDSSKTIEVNYDHCISEIRIKAILRRNSLKHTWITPTLSMIKYEFVTLD